MRISLPIIGRRCDLNGDLAGSMVSDAPTDQGCCAQSSDFIQRKTELILIGIDSLRGSDLQYWNSRDAFSLSCWFFRRGWDVLPGWFLSELFVRFSGDR